MQTRSRTRALTGRVLVILSDLSGKSFSPTDADCTFLELGFDPLLLGQVTQRLALEMDVTLTSPQLMSKFPTVSALVAHLDAVLPPEPAAAHAAPILPEAVAPVAPTTGPSAQASTLPMDALAATGGMPDLMQPPTQAMLSLSNSQMEALGGCGGCASTTVALAHPTPEPQVRLDTPAAPAGLMPVAPSDAEPEGRHDLHHHNTQRTEFTPQQIAFLDDLLYPLMRLRGVHVHDGYPSFFSTAHTEEASACVLSALEGALDRLQSVGILAGEKLNGGVRISRTLPLTDPQKEIWVAEQLGDVASGVFTEALSLSLKGKLDVTALETALNTVIARHDALRLQFDPSGQVARVVPELRLSLHPRDMDHAGLDTLIAQDATAAFDLTEGPLVRVALARVAAEEHVLLLTAHSIVCDRWSQHLMIQEMATLYNAAVTGEEANLPAPLSFADYARYYNLRSPSDHTAAFWSATFPDTPDLPDLPLDGRRDGPRSFVGASHMHQIDADLAQALKRAAGARGVTLFGVLAGSLAALLSRLSGSDDITLAVPMAGQSLLPDDRLVGHCVNLLPVRLRCAMDSETTLQDHLKGATGTLFDCFEHGDTTYGTILRDLKLDADISRHPLTEVQFNFDQQPADLDFTGLDATLTANPRAYANFDLIFNVTESPQGLRIDLTYATDVLSKDTVARWCAHYHRLLRAVIEDMDQPLVDVPLMDAAEAARLAALGNDTDRPAPTWARLEQWIAAQAAATPDAVAVEDTTGPRTYAELASQSNRLAAEIRRRLPEPGARVGVLVERSAGLLVSLLAVLKAGHAYVPMDPHHPSARHRATLEAANVSGLLYDRGVPEAVNGLDIVPIHASCDYPHATLDELHQGGSPDDTAYVIFTSGSTGTPKGVEVSHGALLNFLSSMSDTPGLGADDTVLAVTTVSFDIAGLELFLPLIVGGKTVIARESDVREAFPLVERLSRGDITVLQATPTLWQMLLEAGLIPDARLKILVGGEPLPADLAARLRSFGGQVWNMYGPTETTIWSSCGLVGDGPVRIGAPIANTQLYVMDDAGRLVPIGVTGELNIAGAGLAKGYLGRPDLTNAAYRIVDVPGVGAKRLYRTGDLAQRLPDGAVKLLGRRDGQVKLRGFRIELGEIEAALRSIAGIRAAAADLRDGPTGPLLAGFYVADANAPDDAQILAALATRLPAYMVPARLQRIDALPKTGNGKLDRKALPPLDPVGPATLRTLRQPETDLERDLAEIWRDVLGLDAIGIDQSLFELGADSLSIFRISARMMDRDLGLEARHLMQAPTIASAAALIATRNTAPKALSLKAFRNGARRGVQVSA